MLKCFRKITKKKAKRSFMLEIIYIDRQLVAVRKPIGIPSQPDPSGARDAMTITSEILAERGEDTALWLVHRLDRVVGGILVFARTKKAAAELSRQFSNHELEKCYLAVTEGVAAEGELCDLIFKDAAKSKAFIVDRKRAGVKEARLVSLALSLVTTDGGDRNLVEVRLLTGRFHQIRAQLASRGTPLVGDGKYGSRDKGRGTPALYAYRLAFMLFGRSYELRDLPMGEEYPWSLFSLTEILK